MRTTLAAAAGMSPTPSELLSVTFAELTPEPRIPLTPDVLDLTPEPAPTTTPEPPATDRTLLHRAASADQPGMSRSRKNAKTWSRATRVG